MTMVKFGCGHSIRDIVTGSKAPLFTLLVLSLLWYGLAAARFEVLSLLARVESI